MNEIQKEKAVRLRELHGEIVMLVCATLEKAIEAGEILTEVKESLPHGEFTAWVKKEMSFTIRTAQNYMKVYVNRERLKSESVSFLGNAYKLLETSKTDEAEESIEVSEEELSILCDLWNRRQLIELRHKEHMRSVKDLSSQFDALDLPRELERAFEIHDCVEADVQGMVGVVADLDSLIRIHKMYSNKYGWNESEQEVSENVEASM